MTRLLLELGHRYLPVLAISALVVALVVVVPDRRPGDLAASNGFFGGGGGTAAGAGPGTASGAAGSADGSGAAPGSPGAGSAGGGGGPAGAGGTGSAGAGGGGAAGGGSAPAGPACSGGARQFAFAPYSPLCHTYSGGNGGATAHGVTGDSITVTMRNTSDYDTTASAAGLSSFAAGAHDAAVFVDYFNRQYQLYGRKVVLRTFNGSGSFLAEAGGRDQSGAASDAQAAYDAGAFAEAPVGAPASYQAALASRHIVSFGLPDTLANLQANYPYEYEYLLPAKDSVGQAAGDIVCARLAGQKAVYAGDATLAAMTRSFALITSLQSGNGGVQVAVARAQSKCGATVTKYQYDVNPGQYAPEAAQIAAQLKANNVTTVLLSSDVIFAPVMTTAASADGYHPEWLFLSQPTNGSARQMSADEVAHMIFVAPWHPDNFAPAQDPCMAIYLAASGGAAPQSNLLTVDSLCGVWFEFFGALETAGPNLNPATFGTGFFGQPPSTAAGEFGQWTYGSNAYCGCNTFNLQWWKAGVTSDYDGGSGTPMACSEPADIPYLDTARLGSGQLHCFS